MAWTSNKINRALSFTPITHETFEWYHHSSTTEAKEKSSRGQWKPSVDGRTVQPILNPFITRLIEDVSASTSIRVKHIRISVESVANDFDADGNVEEELALDAPARRLVCDYWTRQWQKAYGFNFRRTMHDVTLLGDRRFRKSTIVQDLDINQDADSGVYLGRFLHAVSQVSTCQPKNRKTNKQLKATQNTIEVVGGEEWRVCKKSVDALKGWAMLSLLETDTEEVE
ncbi:hypothetical protein LTR37_010823 [Vermiconidia calcicola]|uniref:Uncharacterized protein n=1 Tax=Vermiconidia calcicola TaxID=1690605 RepID=A0ACC3N584_9PEZI|nr:hypothetical protein LTR37_010823 [Vermiconidia calcicola]